MTVTFDQFNFRGEIKNALAAQSYITPTPIQAQAIGPALEGMDILGIAQTGTGKTMAFALPILEKLAASGQHARPNHAHALILAPTRELAVQIADNIKKFTPRLNLRLCVILGGVGQQRQADEMRRGADIIVATPGRLLDLMNQNLVHLSMLQVLVLDEADRMLDMGFIHDIKRIIQKIPAQRQTMFFSATMPREVEELSHKMLNHPIRVEVAPVASTAERVEQSVIHVESSQKRAVLVDLLADVALYRVIVFTRTKHGADRVAKHLEKAEIQTGVIHGNKSQNARQNALSGFSKGKLRVLVATDIAARGIDVSDVTHVINFDLPDESESYVHRIGRTARAGKAGVAIAFCGGDERSQLRDIEKLTRQSIPVAQKPAQTQPPEAYLPSANNNGNEREFSRGPRQHGGGHGGKPQNKNKGAPRRFNRSRGSSRAA